MTFTLIKADLERLPSLADALRRGYSPDNMRGAEAARELLRQIDRDPAAVVAGSDDLEGRLPPIELKDGSRVPRLPSFHRWMWDGEFCGMLGARWPADLGPLPDHVPGHVGYSVVEWKRGRGYATRGLALLLPEIKAIGLAFVDLTTDLDNIPSQKVIQANGGRFLGREPRPDAHGGGDCLRWRIDL
ncbi:MAG: hypothetical protein JOZ27_07930 [Caulobacteraceae bacterium]|nr:hypothetical protein [Caulobacteraceae bacterium]